MPEASGPRQETLTDGQQQAFDLLAPTFRGETPRARCVLTGFAGTGKTFLTARLIELALTIPGALGERGDFGKWKVPPAVVITTPTHKAARQLERALAGYKLHRVRVATLHSALGLRPVRNEAVETFQPDPQANQLIGDGTVLVVLDESSMISAELAGLLEGVMPPGAALVAIGDPAQLQPVGDSTLCPLFEAPICAHLSEVVRHAGPILELATATRELGSGRPPFVSAAGDQSAVVAHKGFATWQRAALKACINASREGDTDGSRVLCWTNAAADRFNGILHAAIYGRDAAPWVVGQPVVSVGAIPGPDGLPIVSSTCEMELADVCPEEGSIEGDELQAVREVLLGKRKTKAGEQIPAWQWWAIEARISGNPWRTASFRVLALEQLPSWRKANNIIAAAAREHKEVGNEGAAKDLWRLFWRRKDSFATISPVWAMTVHKAQGSTFRQVFLHPDVGRNPDPASLNQLTYVGITRASHALHVVADRPAAITGLAPLVEVAA
ncbi:AAA family ATPase [Synechococcus sp. CS-1324]|nr:AAA family ATPase [Synechococcus sp. CS-1324]